MSQRKKFGSTVESLDMCEDEAIGFVEGDVDFGKAIASFSFGNINEASSKTLKEPVLNAPAVTTAYCASTPSTPAVTAVNKQGTASIMFNSSNSAAAPGRSPSKSPRIGSTPMIDGESFSIKRGYQLRPSTLRKLHELRALHPDINAYINTIIDEAINHYYNYVLSQRKN